MKVARTMEPFVVLPGDRSFIKELVLEYLHRHFEMASCRALAAAADAAGIGHFNGMFYPFIDDKKAMADWIYGEIPRATEATAG